MQKLATILILLFLLAITALPVAANANDQACWGQASAVFAKTGKRGEHASQVGNPRVGLRNLAHYLFEKEVIEDDTMQSGAYVAAEEGLSIDACMD